MAVCRNNYVLIKKTNVFLGDLNKNFICKRCLSSYTSENMLLLHKQKRGDDDITTNRTSSDTHNQWKKHFHKIPLFFRICSDIEADIEKDNSSIGNKITIIYKQVPLCNGYRIVSELEDVLKSGYCIYPLGYANVNRFVDDNINLENKIAIYFKNNNKDIIMTEKDEEDYIKNTICRFCEKAIECDKVRDHCHLTGKNRGPAHNTCNINVTQEQSSFITFKFQIFSIYDCHMFSKKLVDKTNDKVKFDTTPQTNEDYISVTCGCIRFIDSYRFSLDSLDELVQNLDVAAFKNLEKRIF